MERAHGGPPQVCGHLAQLQAAFNKVTIASYTLPDHELSLAPKEAQSDSIRNQSLAERLFASEAVKYFENTMDGTDIVHLHNVWEPLLVGCSRIATKNDVPYVITPHGMLDPWSMSQKRWKKKLAMQLGRREMIENAKFIHVLNRDEEAGIRQLGIKNRCEIVPNGVTLESIDPFLDPTPALTKFPDLAGKPFVLFLSRLHYKKGLDLLAEATGKFFKSQPDWQLVVAGPDDGMEKKFHDQIKTLGIENRVHMTGPIYGDLKYSLLAACEFFCLPSRQEGFSVAILEALAASKPVVISTGCHFEEVGKAGAGLVTSLDTDEISECFVQLAKSQQTRHEMGQKSRVLVETEYTWDAVVKLLQERYEAT